MTAKKPTDLADILGQIFKSAQAMDSLAARILDAVREAEAATLEQFDTMVYAAYDRCGWSSRVGRPQAGDVPAPHAVKVYISTIRGAYRCNVKVLEMKTMDALRKALKEARQGVREEARQEEARKQAEAAAKVPPELAGVRVDDRYHLTGAIFHDAAVLWENLPEQKRTEFEDKLQILLNKYLKAAPPALRLVA